jgi:Subtilase family
MKFMDEVFIPYEVGAVPDLDPDLLAAWNTVVGGFGFVTLEPLVTSVAADDLRDMVANARFENPGESVPDPTLCFAIEVPDSAFPDPDTVATFLADSLFALSFVESADVEGVLDAAAVNPLQNPQFLFQHYLRGGGVGIGAGGAWAVTGGDGAGVSVGVLEPSDYDRNHRDRPAMRFDVTAAHVNPSTLELEHATAILGLIAAADNTVDCVGVAPNATIVFASGPQNPANLGQVLVGIAFDRLMLLGVQLGAGDVINISTDVQAATVGGVPIDALPIIRSAIRLLTFRGISVVIAAGNSTVNLDTAGVPLPDSGAIVVGGIQATNPAMTTFRRHPFSNFGTHVTCCSWASEVIALIPPIGASDPTTGEFTGANAGTSLATAIISGVVAAMQGRARSHGPALTPATVRNMLGNQAFGSNVVPGQGVGPMPDLDKIIPAV